MNDKSNYLLILSLVFILSSCGEDKIKDATVIPGTYSYKYSFGAFEYWELRDDGGFKQVYYKDEASFLSGTPTHVNDKGKWKVEDGKLVFLNALRFAEGAKMEQELSIPVYVDGMHGVSWHAEDTGKNASISVLDEIGYEYIKQDVDPGAR